MHSSNLYMQRCFDLAKLGAGKVSPNPLVGSIIISPEGKVIGEGYHQKYGSAHAEVNAVHSVDEKNKHLIPDSSIYVSLEPCCIFGKTPPCSSLILNNGIKKVFVSVLDQTAEVKGKSIEILKKAGLEVRCDILKDQGRQISAIRNTFVSKKRPYIILKFAQSKDGFFGAEQKQVWITNKYVKRLVHKWRSEVDAIMVATKTALVDNPGLTNRHYYGKSPVRIVLDSENILPENLQVFDNKAPTIIASQKQRKDIKIEDWVEYTKDQDLIVLMQNLAKKGISSVLVEGGRTLLDSFLELNLWDEMRIFTGDKVLNEGIKAPTFNAVSSRSYKLCGDQLDIYYNKQ